jgi:hypothetical protein
MKEDVGWRDINVFVIIDECNKYVENRLIKSTIMLPFLYPFERQMVHYCHHLSM